MQNNNIPIIDLVFAGGGHSHAIALKMFAMNPIAGVRITLISENVDTPYSGMLPGLLAGHFNFDQCHIDLRHLCEAADVNFIQGKVVSVDPLDNKVYLVNRPAIHFDVLSINIGSTPDLSALTSGQELVHPVKPIAKFLPKINQLDNSDFKELAIVGGGAAGVELALSLDYRFNNKLNKSIKISLFNADQEILNGHNKNVRIKVNDILQKRNISVFNQSVVKEISLKDDKKYLNFIHQNSLSAQNSFDEVIWATHASAAGWLKNSGLKLNEAGFIEVNNNLQTLSYKNIFATGDISTIQGHERAKSGVFAVRQGMPLYENIKRFILKQALKAYFPQQHFLSLLNCGNQYSIASWRNMAFSGKWLWFVKRFIDQRFMQQFQQLKGMNNNQTIDEHYRKLATSETYQQIRKISERCGGCGAKVAGSLLNQVLSRLSQHDKDGIVAIQKDDAAVFNIPANHQIVQSIDYFRSFIADPYLLGQVATTHALSDLYAMGAKPHSAQVLIGLPFMAREQQQETLFQLMSGIVHKLKQEQVILIGGHTNESLEMGCGLTVNGFIKENEITRKSSLKNGQCLVLTKALGTGIILAANMQSEAKGRWVENCFTTMLKSSARAAEILKKYKITACTDITGFGLVGHLSEMLTASKCQAKLDFDKIPYLQGVDDCLDKGILSSLYNENLAYESIIEHISQKPLRYPILFDPQTAGGLLAAIDCENARDFVNELIEAGYEDASIIGQVIKEQTEDIKLFI
ncbi:MAG: selenide, water dikinase SelD [Gammaproteobacteria bacterium]|nr:selenide, water dikinase SelD [Gammaproteobacteria bacterium]